jgi:hypothetical protein
MRFMASMRNSTPGPVASPPPSSSSAPTGGGSDKRQHLRFDKVFPVRIESILFGESNCVARNVSAGGIFLETSDPLPLGARVQVRFLTPDESTEIVALGEVKNHYFMNYVQAGVTKSVAGMAVRFISFEDESRNVLKDCLNRFRVLH